MLFRILSASYPYPFGPESQNIQCSTCFGTISKYYSCVSRLSILSRCPRAAKWVILRGKMLQASPSILSAPLQYLIFILTTFCCVCPGFSKCRMFFPLPGQYWKCYLFTSCPYAILISSLPPSVDTFQFSSLEKMRNLKMTLQHCKLHIVLGHFFV